MGGRNRFYLLCPLCHLRSTLCWWKHLYCEVKGVINKSTPLAVETGLNTGQFVLLLLLEMQQRVVVIIHHNSKWLTEYERGPHDDVTPTRPERDLHSTGYHGQGGLGHHA